jgi:hypothetical protein
VKEVRNAVNPLRLLSRGWVGAHLRPRNPDSAAITAPETAGPGLPWCMETAGNRLVPCEVAADVDRAKGRRDRWLLAAELPQMQVARLVFGDMECKGGRVRSVPTPNWTMPAIDARPPWLVSWEMNRSTALGCMAECRRGCGVRSVRGRRRERDTRPPTPNHRSRAGTTTGFRRPRDHRPTH